jgi:hypothetical protein
MIASIAQHVDTGQRYSSAAGSGQLDQAQALSTGLINLIEEQ